MGRVGPYEPTDLDEEEDLLPDKGVTVDELENKAREVRLAIHTHIPATVVAYDPAKQEVSCLLGHLPVVICRDGIPPAGVKAIYGIGDQMTAVVQTAPLLGIRVAWPGTDQGYLTFPLLPGACGYLHVSDRSMEHWKAKNGEPVDPVLAILHDPANSTFEPTRILDSKRITPPTDQTAVVLEGTQVKVGRMAALHAAQAEPLQTFLQALLAAIQAATAPPGGGALTFAAPSLPNFSAAKVMVE